MPRTARPSPVFNYVFTLNNPTQAEVAALTGDWETRFSYLVFGRETGDSGTPHLQGYFRLQAKQRLTTVRQYPGLARAHFEVMRGTSAQAIAYCKKDGDFDEFGEPPRSNQGKRSDWEDLVSWIKAQETYPTEATLWENFPSLMGRSRGGVNDCLRVFAKRPTLVDGTLRTWQQDLLNMLNGPADDRRVIFVVDPDGGKGKSWLTRYLLSNRDDIQFLSVGKRDDLAFAVDTSKRVFLFDIPRGQSEYLQYGVLEQLKNQLLFSPKYESVTKVIPEKVHVVVFMNEMPDEHVMTGDRYMIINI